VLLLSNSDLDLGLTLSIKRLPKLMSQRKKLTRLSTRDTTRLKRKLNAKS